MGTFGRRPRRLGGFAALVAVVLAMVLGTSAVSAALVSGSLPTAGLTYTSVTENAVNMAGDAIRLKIKDSATVKTTYSFAAPSDTALVGSWHYHNGPVFVTVTAGTLTLYDSRCGSWDIAAGQTYIESTGQVLVAKALASKNTESVQWFTTRVYPEGAIDPVAVDAPCTPA
jgi:fructose-1,6-bisphosphatase/inositol monophosphatase family enzyme